MPKLSESLGKIWVLRLGHRVYRDLRVTTHCALTARALGANGMILSGQEDPDLINKIAKLNSKWGGEFEVRYERNWKKVIRDWKSNGCFVILSTVYGINLDSSVEILREAISKSDILIVVGSQKVPGEVYDMVDYDIAVTHQPHSEVAALALIIDRIFSGNELNFSFPGSRVRIVPREKGKEAVFLANETKNQQP